MRTSTFRSDMKMLLHMTMPIRYTERHSDRLEAFYAEQSPTYDLFRDRLLHGREQLMRAIPVTQGGTLLDMGGGTGRNVSWLGERRAALSKIGIIDLCSSLLRVADERIRDQKWNNVYTRIADVTTYQPAEGPVDAITFSYSLTMIPNWIDALENAYAQLKPGGYIGVVDFYVSHKWPSPGMVKHSALARSLWPIWFNYSNVFLSADHLSYLARRFQSVRLDERHGKVPYLAGLKAPYYLFIGRKPPADGDVKRDRLKDGGLVL